MYATSKLIIPAKIAQDSPYVPKIRICLRPSPSLDSNNTMGSSLGSADLLGDTSEPNEVQNDATLVQPNVKIGQSAHPDLHTNGDSSVSTSVFILCHLVTTSSGSTKKQPKA